MSRQISMWMDGVVVVVVWIDEWMDGWAVGWLTYEWLDKLLPHPPASLVAIICLPCSWLELSPPFLLVPCN